MQMPGMMSETDIASTQQAEIDQFRQWQKEWATAPIGDRELGGGRDPSASFSHAQPPARARPLVGAGRR
jgi:hypothetical protein